ncbi:TetR/AcrR family transcriptional regulator [Streptomyces beihaiensis]|uniref:TetR/AcrR family transcriptional regulator n=1 Tax=Streptomyces beihaiensis TaxID=2984495 RepID=A0ABT3TX13_9ACTN|nr:TetR/AcrR family transcriptional regulator [Streptomyces beihaiensis]MCX3061595.1 TetR/AcrR family transcriptional regulator [Streptomyces beihaiensis]
MRADARRNRERLLDAAEKVFAARGPAAATEEVAKEAGVGVGTLFRHFPTKEALLEAVFQARMDAGAARMEELADAADPGAAFREMFLRNVEESRSKIAYINALATAGVDVDGSFEDTKKRLRAALGVVLERAQETGDVRPDVTAADVIALMVGAARAAEHTDADAAADVATERDGTAPGTAARAHAAEVVLDGLTRRR